MPLSPGTRLGPYEILAPIGAGGMGEVYKAHDSRLGRMVAVKVCHDRFSDRFAREARAVAALNHPAICTVHDVGPDYLVMEYVEGGPVKSPLPAAEVVQYAAQIAEGLAAAHAKGIVHRDLKPGNLMVTAEGRVKILDFGLATRTLAATAAVPDATLTAALTDPGTAVGTVAYMSPEQARGESVDARTDLWSLGVVMYEMLAGARPFEGTTQAVLFEALLNKPPLPLGERQLKAPPELERIIYKLLEKNRALRYQSAAEVLADLKRLERDSSAGAQAATPVSRGGRKRMALPAAAAGVLAIAVLGFLFYPPAGAIDSLAVLPFANSAGNSDTEYLSDGITESLAGSLSGLPGLKVISANAVRKYKGQNPDVRQVARELGVRAIVTGRIAQHRDNLSVSAEFVDARDNAELWGEHYDRKMADILTVQQEIVTRISEKLRLRLNGAAKQRLSNQGTGNPEAYQLYIKGKYFASQFTRDGVAKGLDYLRQAIALDPNYALAYDGLAGYYSIVDDVFVPAREACPKGEEAARKLIALDDSRAEGHADLAALLFWYEYDWAGAEKEMKRANELNPNYASNHEMHGWLLAAMGRTEEGIAEGRKAVQLEPLDPEHADILGQSFYLARRHAEAVEQFRKSLDLDPKYWLAEVGMAFAYLQLGKPGEAAGIARKAHEDEPLADWATGTLIAALAADRKSAEAGKVLDELTAKAKAGWVPSFAFAVAYLGLGDKGRALSFLEKAYEERSWQLTFLKTDPFFDPFRAEPRFQRILERINFPK